MRVRINTGFYKGREGIAKEFEDTTLAEGREFAVDVLNPDGSVANDAVWYGEDELEVL